MSPAIDPRPVAIIPAYKPEPVLPTLVDALLATGVFSSVVLVDDGSGLEHAPMFERLSGVPGVVLLAHHVNLGKGAALKTALNWVGTRCPDAVGAVTLDADGQHAADDVVAVARALSEQPSDLVLGCRTFPATVPLRSRFGNIVTRWVMRAVAGLKVSDTQTGLRGVPASLFGHLLRLRTSGYDFELDMLLAVRQLGVKIVEVPISTIYIDENRSSHFNPIRDSLKIYYVFLRFNLSSLSAFLVDYSLFTLLHLLGVPLVICQFGARLVSSAFNFAVNRSLVFKSNRSFAGSLLLYYATVVLIAVCSYSLIVGMNSAFGMSVLAAKLIADSVLYVASFSIQREFVFRKLVDAGRGHGAG